MTALRAISALCAVAALSAQPVQAALVPIDISIAYFQNSKSGSLSTGHLFENGRYATMYRFKGSAGQQVRLYLNSSEFDTYLVLGTEDGTDLADNDNMNTNSTNSEIVFTLAANGTYMVMVTSKSEGQKGSYTLYFENTKQ
jgi:hypothetical protein